MKIGDGSATVTGDELPLSHWANAWEGGSEAGNPESGDRQDDARLGFIPTREGTGFSAKEKDETSQPAGSGKFVDGLLSPLAEIEGFFVFRANAKPVPESASITHLVS